MTDRIDHAAEATRSLADADRFASVNCPLETGEHKADIIATAQVHATLALVEQQRIANLIALAKETFATHEASEALGTFATAKSGERIGLRPDIAAALDIEAVDHD